MAEQPNDDRNNRVACVGGMVELIDVACSPLAWSPQGHGKLQPLGQNLTHRSSGTALLQRCTTAQHQQQCCTAAWQICRIRGLRFEYATLFTLSRRNGP
eukprot:jgi/Botrbrau1/11623/Bobra.0209s0014.1